MATASEILQFKRLVGDFNVDIIDTDIIESYLDDAARQVTASEGTMIQVDDFDDVESSFKPEIITLAAINWWWNRASELLEKHSTSVGQASQNVGEKYDRAMRMIEMLQGMYKEQGILSHSVTIGNFSRFSKTTLTRLGGQKEEDFFA